MIFGQGCPEGVLIYVYFYQSARSILRKTHLITPDFSQYTREWIIGIPKISISQQKTGKKKSQKKGAELAREREESGGDGGGRGR